MRYIGEFKANSGSFGYLLTLKLPVVLRFCFLLLALLLSARDRVTAIIAAPRGDRTMQGSTTSTATTITMSTPTANAPPAPATARYAMAGALPMSNAQVALRLRLGEGRGVRSGEASHPGHELIIRFDGACKANGRADCTWPVGCGAAVFLVGGDGGEQLVFAALGFLHGDPKRRPTNNIAEYASCHLALSLAVQLASVRTVDKITVEGDSKLVVTQTEFDAAVESRTLVRMCEANRGLLSLARGSATVLLEHVQRERNALADALANAAYDAGSSCERKGDGSFEHWMWDSRREPPDGPMVGLGWLWTQDELETPAWFPSMASDAPFRYEPSPGAALQRPERPSGSGSPSTATNAGVLSWLTIKGTSVTVDAPVRARTRPPAAATCSLHALPTPPQPPPTAARQARPVVPPSSDNEDEEDAPNPKTAPL